MNWRHIAIGILVLGLFTAPTSASSLDSEQTSDSACPEMTDFVGEGEIAVAENLECELENLQQEEVKKYKENLQGIERVLRQSGGDLKQSNIPGADIAGRLLIYGSEFIDSSIEARF